MRLKKISPYRSLPLRKILISLLTLTTFNKTHANDFKFSIEKPIPFIGGSDYNKENLQKSGQVKIDQIGVHYYLGEDIGYYLGLVSSKEQAAYTQYETTTRPYGHFSSSYLNLGPELGLWAQPSTILRLEGGLTVSHGDFEISDSTSSIATLSNIRKIDLHFSYIYPANILSPDIILDLFAKLGYYKVFLNEFSYNGVVYSTSELNLKSYIYFSIGFGIRF